MKTMSDLRLTNSDKRVLLSFIDRQPNDNKKFYTDGNVLDGLWVGGNDLAHWDGNQLVIQTPSGRASQTVSNFLRKNTSDVFLSSYGIRKKAMPRNPSLMSEQERQHYSNEKTVTSLCEKVYDLVHEAMESVYDDQSETTLDILDKIEYLLNTSGYIR